MGAVDSAVGAIAACALLFLARCRRWADRSGLVPAGSHGIAGARAAVFTGTASVQRAGDGARHTATLFGALPLLFAGFGSLIVPRGLAVDRLAGWPLAPLAFHCLAIDLAAYLVALALSLAGVAPAPGPGGGWTVYAPLSSAAPYTVSWLPISAADLALVGLRLGYVSMGLMAVSFIATLFGRKGAGTAWGAVPPSTWAFAAASIVGIVLLAAAGYEWLLITRADLGNTFFSTPEPWPFRHLSSVDLAPPLLLICGIGVASRAMEVAAGRSSVSPRLESLAIVLIAIDACAIALLPVAQLLPAPAGDFAGGTIVTAGPGLSAAAALMLSVLAALWLAVMIRGRERRLVPALWVTGALILWACALGATWFVGTRGLDRVLHDTYYTVAIEHWSVTMAACFAWFAGWYAIFTEITGRRYLPWLAALQAVLALIGTALTFGAQIWLGFMGMPRRYADYPDAFATLNFYSSIGSYLALSSIILFFGVLLLARRDADAAEGDAHN
jgi:cytochrome c oxidase subunit 1